MFRYCRQFNSTLEMDLVENSQLLFLYYEWRQRHDGGIQIDLPYLTWIGCNPALGSPDNQFLIFFGDDTCCCIQMNCFPRHISFQESPWIPPEYHFNIKEIYDVVKMHSIWGATSTSYNLLSHFCTENAQDVILVLWQPLCVSFLSVPHKKMHFWLQGDPEGSN